MTELSQRHLTANGVDFALLETGSPSGPLALCLHGFPDTPWGFEPLLHALADAGFHAVAPFMRGYAPTEVPADGRYQTGVLAADALALHDALGGSGDAVLVGHDWGALGGYGAAGADPDRWARVAFAAVPPAAISSTFLFDYDHLKQRFWYQFFLCNPLADFVVPMNDLEFIERLWADWSPGFDGTTPVGRVKEAIGEPANLNAAITYYRHTLGLVDQDPALAELQDLCFAVPPQPMLYLHGVDDGCMPCPEASAVAALLPEGSEVVLVDDAGHFLQYEQPTRFADAIVAFVTR